MAVIRRRMICLVIIIMNLGNSFNVIPQMHESSNSCSGWRHIGFNQASPICYLVLAIPVSPWCHPLCPVGSGLCVCLACIRFTEDVYDAKEKYRGMLEIQMSGDKTSSGGIGLDIRTHASPKVGQDQVSGGVSVPVSMPHPLQMPHGNLYSVMSNSVRSQIRETAVNGWCNVCSSVSGLNKRTFANPKRDRTRCPEEKASSVGMPHPLHMFYGNLCYSFLVNRFSHTSWVIVKVNRQSR